MKHDYYAHKSEGHIADHFGDIGVPYKICWLRFILMKVLRYRVTKIVKGATMKELAIKCCTDAGAHNESFLTCITVVKFVDHARRTKNV